MNTMILMEKRKEINIPMFKIYLFLSFRKKIKIYKNHFLHGFPSNYQAPVTSVTLYFPLLEILLWRGRYDIYTYCALASLDVMQCNVVREEILQS